MEWQFDYAFYGTGCICSITKSLNSIPVHISSCICNLFQQGRDSLCTNQCIFLPAKTTSSQRAAIQIMPSPSCYVKPIVPLLHHIRFTAGKRQDLMTLTVLVKVNIGFPLPQQWYFGSLTWLIGMYIYQWSWAIVKFYYLRSGHNPTIREERSLTDIH